MPQKIGELEDLISFSVDDRLIVYNIDTEDTTLGNPGTITDSITNIIHTDVSSEIAGITYKSTPHASDIVLIEDSEDSFSKKKIPLSTLGGGSGGIPDAPVDSKVYARQDGNWVDPNIDLVSSRVLWEASTPPDNQLCLVNNVPQVVTFSSVPLTDPKLSVDLGLGEIAVLEDLNNLFIAINLQITRLDAISNSVGLWGFSTEVWDGVSWLPYSGSTKHETFVKGDGGQVSSVSLTSIFDSVPANTKFRFLQVTDDVSLSIGITSTKPFTSMPTSPGILISIGTR